jgi:hypothetical protein
MPREKKRCQECEEPLIGRADKKFCCDQCRNAFNNRHNADANNMVRNINNALRRNRRIIDRLIGSGKEQVRRERLLSQGFSFSFYTHQTERSGNVYRYCYEVGYAALNEETILLIKQEQLG